MLNEIVRKQVSIYKRKYSLDINQICNEKIHSLIQISQPSICNSFYQSNQAIHSQDKSALQVKTKNIATKNNFKQIQKHQKNNEINGKFQKETISIITKKNDNTLQKLKQNQLFYCCKCFQYIFRIELNLHYPKCLTQKEIFNFSDQNKYQIGCKRIQLIYELSQYTKTKILQIEFLYDKFKNNECIMGILSYQLPFQRSYLFLSEIEISFIWTYYKLIQGSINNSSVCCNYFSICNKNPPKLEFEYQLTSNQ